MYNKADWRNNRTEKGFCMKEIRTEDAVGHILCHDITQIIKDEKKGVLFKKGHVVKEDDIPLLLSVGKEHLFVWEKKEGILHENEAAEILYRICAGDSLKMHGTDIKEGKIEVVSEIDGVLKIRREALVAVNSLGEMMIASRHGDFPVKRGNGIHEDAQISQNRLCCDREYDQQHDTFSGHIRNGEQLVQIGTAEYEGNNRSDQDRPAHPVERLADPVENHKTDNGEQYGGSGRNIFRADRKFLAEDDECCDHQKVGQRRRQGPCQNVRDKVARDPVFVRH